MSASSNCLAPLGLKSLRLGDERAKDTGLRGFSLHNGLLMSSYLFPTSPLTALAAAAAIVFLTVLGWSTAGRAAQADRNAATVVESASLSHDDKNGVTVFEGNVVLTKGSLILQGSRMVLRKQESGAFTAEVTGTPARVQQARDTPGELIRGEGSQIVYNSQNELAVLTGQAVMRRLSGSQLLDQLVGERLLYSSVTETYSVEGIGAGSNGEVPGRVQMTILPRPAEATTPANRRP